MNNGNTQAYPSPARDGLTRPSFPRITPTRRTLDNRFPQLAFSVQTDGRPYYEILLTTDPGLFAPERAGERTAANFHPVRSDERRLQPALGGSAIFIVPQPVLHAFAAATPRPTAIYYTAVTYADAAGSEPAFALSLEELVRHAPSVQLSADFRAETLAAVLGTSVSKLHRYQSEARAAPVAAASLANRIGNGAHLHAAPLATTAPAGPDGPQDGYEAHHQPALSAAPASGQAHAYDDGFGDWPTLGVAHSRHVDESEYGEGHLGDQPDDPPYARPQESTFPPGLPEPAALQDAEEPWLGDEYADDAEAFAYDDGFGDLPTSAASGANGQQRTDGTPYLAASAGTTWYGEPEGAEQADALAANGDLYGDEADRFAYDDAFGLDEASDLFDPELPYEPLSAELGGGGTASASQPLTIDVQRTIIERIRQFESGRDGYSAMNRDGEFRGLFGHDHSAYNRYHIGLSYGIVQFTQDGGTLGQLLTMMRERDRGRFDAIFGEHADDLIRVTNAAGPPSREAAGGRSARVQPVGGADLWEEPWLSRFAEAGRHVPFQAAQNELAARVYIAPILPFARWLGLNTDRALAIVVDRAVQMGVGGARRWIARVVGPIQTASQRQQALAALGHADLRSFQRSTAGLSVDGDWGPLTHAAMVAALRALGSASPVQIPSREQMLDMLVRQSASERWGHRVQTLRGSSDFTDTVYDF